MSTKGNTNPTLIDLTRRLDPDGKVAPIVELLHEVNEVLFDMSFKEGNLLTGHQTTQRTGLPGVSWRKLNQGVAQSKSQTQQITDTCGMLEAYAEVDKDYADLNGNTAAWRLSEDMAFLEAMNIELAQTLFYGDVTTDPEEFTGFSPRYDTPSTSVNNIGYNMIDCGGSGSDNTSVWVGVWGDKSAFGIVPKGSTGGFKHEDLGQVTLFDSNNNKYEGYRSHYQLKAGLALKNWKYWVRICNIDVSDLTKDKSGSSCDLIDAIVQAIELLPDTISGRAVIYCNRTIRSFLRRQINNTTNNNLTYETIAGKKVLFFDEIPVRRTDGILNSEATVAGTFAHSA
jgi:hypothetical protein